MKRANPNTIRDLTDSILFLFPYNTLLKFKHLNQFIEIFNDQIMKINLGNIYRKMFHATVKTIKKRQIAQFNAEQWNGILDELIEKLDTPGVKDVFEKFVQMHRERDERNEVRARGMRYFIDQILRETDIYKRLDDLEGAAQKQHGEPGEKTKAFTNLVNTYDPCPGFVDEGGKPGYAPF